MTLPRQPDDEPQIEIVSVPALDTGIGREMGYKDDAEFIAASEAQRAALPPQVRAVLDKAVAKMDRRFLFGDDDR